MQIPGHPLIHADPAICGGKPTIRGMRIRVVDIMEMMAGGMSENEILSDFPYVTRDDIRASLGYAADMTRHPVLVAEQGKASVRG